MLPRVLDVEISIYGMPGDYINFDVDHVNPDIDSQISSYRIARVIGKMVSDWLNVSPSGQLYGEIPQGFENGGANIVATHPRWEMCTSGSISRCRLQKRMMEKRYLLAILG